MSETSDEITNVVTGTTRREPSAAVAVLTVVLLAGIFGLLLAVFLRMSEDLDVLKSDVAVLRSDVTVLRSDVAEAVELLRPVADNARADLLDCGPGAARNTMGECIIG